jgi:hypothetical protein
MVVARHVFGICYLLRQDELAAISTVLSTGPAPSARSPFEPAAAVTRQHGGRTAQPTQSGRIPTAAQEGSEAATSVVIDLIVARVRALTISVLAVQVGCVEELPSASR